MQMKATELNGRGRKGAYMITLQTGRFRYDIGEDGRNLSFIDRQSGRNYIADSYCALLTDYEKQQHLPVSVSFEEELLRVRFDNGIEIATKVEFYEEFLTFTLQEVSSQDFHAVAFVNLEVDIDYSSYSPDTGEGGFTASLMGFTVATRMAEHPGRNTRLSAEGYPHIGLFGTNNSIYPVKAAVLGTQDGQMRDLMKQVMELIPDGEMPKSKLGGPWAYDVPDARRTYSNSGAVTLEEVEAAIADFKRLGISQVGIHQGKPYTQGDFQVCKEMYPGGLEDFKKLIRIYHEHGFQVGLHSYTFFVAHESKYLSPVPHPDLDHICELTLVQPLGADDTTVYVDTLEGVAEIYSSGLVSSRYIQIGEELLRFGGVDHEKNAFVDCERGAQGTAISAHQTGDQVCQLKERFCFVAPRAGSELFYEVARNTAEFYNECDFDGFYLDAIDGVYALEGNDYAWYHAMDFINEMFKYLKKPPIFNCCYNPQYTGSWYARSRYGALDAAVRAQRDYIDAHVGYEARTAERMYLPTELGWFDLYSTTPHYGWQARVMTTDDVEYLCSKVLGTDCSMSYRGASIFGWEEHPILDRYSEIVRRFDRARYSGQLTPALRKRLKEPGAEFTLEETEGSFLFREADTEYYKMEDMNGGDDRFICENRFAQQTPSIRLEALYAAAAYEEEGIILKEFDENEPVPNDMLYTLDENGPINACGNHGVGVWVYGDGSGVSMRIRLQSRLAANPSKNTEFYVKCDFTGWRYFAFYEAQNGDAPHEEWPRTEMVYRVFTDVGKFYQFYRDGADYSALSFLHISLNTDQPTGIRLRTIRLLPYYENVLKNPTLLINGKAVTFHCQLHPRHWLEWKPDGSCEILDTKGNVIERPTVSGDLPILMPGENEVVLTSEEMSDSREQMPARKRAAVTLRMIGNAIGE